MKVDMRWAGPHLYVYARGHIYLPRFCRDDDGVIRRPFGAFTSSPVRVFAKDELHAFQIFQEYDRRAARGEVPVRRKPPG